MICVKRKYIVVILTIFNSIAHVIDVNPYELFWQVSE